MLRPFAAMLALLLSAVGCAPASSMESIRPVPSIVRSYEIGASARAAIGDPFFEVSTGEIVPSFVALRTVQGRERSVFGTYLPTVIEGEPYRATATDVADGSFAIAPGSAAAREGWTVETLTLRVTSEGRPVGWRGHPMGEQVGVAYLAPDSAPLFRRTGVISQGDNSFRAQLIYSGLSGRTIRVVYREFSNDLARPSFTQELTYNLDESQTIAFRTVQVQVISATNSALEYRVIEDGGLPWLPQRPVALGAGGSSSAPNASLKRAVWVSFAGGIAYFVGTWVF